MPKLLVTDRIAPEGLKILESKLDVDCRLGIPEDKIAAIISDYAGLLVRSQTKVTRRIIESASSLKVIGRAGVGVDNIDIDAATECGVMVVNSPGGNTLAVVEFTLGMMLALLRHIPQAHASLREGQWSRSRYVGTQALGKTLGIIGLGRIGTEVALRAKVFGMEVIGSDPFLSQQRAQSLGIQLMDYREVFQKADLITFHCPLTKETRNLINAESIAGMKDGVLLVNCARGGVFDENALTAALASGKVAGAAIDVYSEEPPRNSPLLQCDNVVTTPHLAASTHEAQVDVAVDVAEQIVDVFDGKTPKSAVNLPAIPLEILGELRPYLVLAEKLGRMQGQLAKGSMDCVEILYGGHLVSHETGVLTRSFLKGLMGPVMPRSVNMVNAPLLAHQRGIEVVEKRESSAGDYASIIATALITSSGRHDIAGTVFGKSEPRIIRLDGYRMDIVPEGHVLLSDHTDKAGVIGRVGTEIGKVGVNIAGMHVGRQKIGGDAIMVLNVDAQLPDELLDYLSTLDNISNARMVDFSI